MRKLIAICALALAGCEHVATVPTVSGAPLATVGQRQPGNYSATIQTGGWNMSVSSSGWSCSIHSFNADLNGPWESAMKEALMSAVEKIDFTAAILKAPEISAGTYDASIIVTQFNATSKFAVVPGFMSATANTSTNLQVILVITWPDGRSQQEIINGQGSSSGSAGMFCSSVGDRVSESTARAIQDVIRQTIVTTKLLLAQGKATPAAASSAAAK